MTRKMSFLALVLLLSPVPRQAASGLTRHAPLLRQQHALISPQSKADQTKEEVLTNDSVIQLLKVGLDEGSIIAKIQKTKYNFDTSTEGLVALKQAGASTARAPEII